MSGASLMWITREQLRAIIQVLKRSVNSQKWNKDVSSSRKCSSENATNFVTAYFYCLWETFREHRRSSTPFEQELDERVVHSEHLTGEMSVLSTAHENPGFSYDSSEVRHSFLVETISRRRHLRSVTSTQVAVPTSQLARVKRKRI